MNPSGQPTNDSTDKPVWVDALEDSLLLAISMFALITWFVLSSLLNR